MGARLFLKKTMSKKKQDLLTLALILILAMVAFGAGFLANEFLDLNGTLFSNSEDGDFGVFWEAWSRVEDSYIGDLPATRDMTYGAIRGAISVLGDPYTVFIEPIQRSDERDRLRGNFGGIGANVTLLEDNRIMLSPIPGNPAEAAGILEGDILVAVDGLDITSEMTLEDVVSIIRGEEGTEVILTVLHPGSDDPVDITIIRGTILLPSVSYRILDEDSSIGYIILNRFSGESAGEVEEAIADLQEQGATKLILDLRHNGGGLLDAAIDVSDHFLDSGPVAYQLSSKNSEKVFNASDETIARDVPLVVLTDEATASAAEIVAGALQDRDRATLIGNPTFGKGSVQIVYELSDGSSIHVTSARWLTPNRHQLDQQGLQPDFLVEVTDEALLAGRDEVLEAAINYFHEAIVDQHR